MRTVECNGNLFFIFSESSTTSRWRNMPDRPWAKVPRATPSFMWQRIPSSTESSMFTTIATTTSRYVRSFHKMWGKKNYDVERYWLIRDIDNNSFFFCSFHLFDFLWRFDAGVCSKWVHSTFSWEWFLFAHSLYIPPISLSFSMTLIPY